MATYTAPTTRATGFLVTAAEWNALADNTAYLKDAPTIDGLLTLGAGQLAFPASQNASSGANTLDDYEEGTWTPVIGGATSQTGQSYATQVGRYVKVGRTVMANFHATLTNKGTITGGVILRGLPFAAANAGSSINAVGTVNIGNFDAMTTSIVRLSGFVGQTETVAYMYLNTAAATAGVGVAAADLSNATSWVGAVVYEAGS